MKVSVKKQLMELVEYVEFPMGVYIYETGKVVASNRAAKSTLNGTSCQNINLLWADHKKLKLSPDILNGGSRIFFRREVLVGQEIKQLDMEVNVIPCSGEHIVVAFFEDSYKQLFRTNTVSLLPGFIWKGADGEVITANAPSQKGLQIYSETKEDREHADKDLQDMLQRAMEVEQQVLESKSPLFCQVEQIDFEKRGNQFLKINRLPIFGKKDEYMGLITIFKPILSEDDFYTLFNSVLYEKAVLRECLTNEDKIMLSVAKDDTLHIYYTTPNVNLLGYTIEYIVKNRVNWSDLIHPDDLDRVRTEIREGLDGKEPTFKQKYRIIAGDGSDTWVNTMNFKGDDRMDGGHMRVILWLDDKEKVQKRKPQVVMKKETYLDFLTGLPNRIKYEEDAKQLIQAAISTNKKGYVITLDLDDFKHINEAFGPEYGDILLKRISKSLNDIPEVENYCYRVDGDEFLLFVRGEYAEQIEHIIENCLQLFHNSWQLRDKECYCSVSIGIAEYPKDSTQPKELLKYADAAVYEAKRKGKNRIQHYMKTAQNTSLERVNYERYLRKAIEKGCVEFSVFFQPIVRTTTKEVIGAEALVRWYSPELGFITPINFISLSEYLGLIVPLGEYVLQQSFITCKRWNEERDPEFCVSVNLSVVQLVQPNIVERILEIVQTTGVNTENVVLEVTESLAVEDMGLMKSVLMQLKENGFCIALDDFGTGYSSLNHIMEMPLDFVKIDKSFVSGYGTENFNPSLLSAITELAHSVNMEVIVEGVETKQQMEFLMFLDADKIQGYLYGKPMPEDEFEENVFRA